MDLVHKESSISPSLTSLCKSLRIINTNVFKLVWNEIPLTIFDNNKTRYVAFVPFNTKTFIFSYEIFLILLSLIMLAITVFVHCTGNSKP